MKKSDKIGIVVAIIFLLFCLLSIFLREYSLKTNYKFTIAEIYKISDTGRSGPEAHYSFYFKGHKYNNFDFIDDFDRSLVGKKFYVKFSPIYRRYSKLVFERSVPPNLKEAPPEGWKEIPKN